LFLGVRGERVLGVFQRRQHGLLVGVKRLLLPGILDVDVGHDAARLK
jgi:hypothetical protein